MIKTRLFIISFNLFCFYVKSSIEFCDSPPEKGPCNGLFIRYFYDSKIGTCLPFIYGGCKGNENNFGSDRACRGWCVKPSDPSFDGPDPSLDENIDRPVLPDKPQKGKIRPRPNVLGRHRYQSRYNYGYGSPYYGFD